MVMSKKTYRINAGSIHEQCFQSRAKIQMMGGGFANGKTALLVMKALRVAEDYPGANILLARETYPKLNDTLRKEFLKWCPKDWIKSFPMSANSSNTCALINGTTINFRYVNQQGKNSETGQTSNLLSATYDFIGIDQVEDPGITHKDFLDLLGRLRGSAVYRGNDKTMPATGPRWLMLTCNPTRNWVYRKLVKPFHLYKQYGIITPELLFNKRLNAPDIEVFEGSTYENKDNLAADFIESLENSYQGAMRDRFLLGKWSAYEGLVYPQFDYETHVVDHDLMMKHFRSLHSRRVQPTIIEAFDFGLAVPSCYGFGYADDAGNTFLLDGFYEKELGTDDITDRIRKIRWEHCRNNGITQPIYADPSIFRRSGAGKKTVGLTTAELLADDGKGIICRPANNDVINGIVKVQSYLTVQRHHINPFFGTYPAPLFFVSSRCDWFINEISDYYWKISTETDAQEDRPRDVNDHAMDMLRYMFTDKPAIARALKVPRITIPSYMHWTESEENTMRQRKPRYG